jgi:uncharacterized membrane protein
MTSHEAKPARTCQICGSNRRADLRPGVLVRPAVAELIEQEAGRWVEEGWICLDDLQRFRHKYVQTILEREKGEITDLEKEVIESLNQQEILSRNPEEDIEADLTFGQRIADRIADFGGSWRFMMGFAFVLFLWIVTNTWMLAARPFDPYPFILLNLVLSCLAAIQAPVIMMSQNRQDAKDRLRSEHDYQLNLKAELEIRHLNEKMDLLLTTQWRRLLEIQRIQMEVLEELVRETRQKTDKNS